MPADTSTPLFWIALAVPLWLLFALFCRILLSNPRGDVPAGFAVLFMRIYSRVLHRLHVEGRQNIPPRRPRTPVLVVANHSAGVDPVLIQSAVPFEIRFMMARDMQPAWLAGLWRFTNVIPVSRDGGDTAAAREAIRHLRHGGRNPSMDPDPAFPGAVGIFPEGGIERPPRRLLPFTPGVGLLIHKSGAVVLPVVIEGAPYTSTAWGSLFARSRSRLRFLPPIDYSGSSLKPTEIAADLQARFLAATGWPLNTAPIRTMVRA